MLSGVRKAQLHSWSDARYASPLDVTPLPPLLDPPPAPKHATPLQSLLAPPPSLHTDTHDALDAHCASNVTPFRHCSLLLLL
eukprot:2132602-Rhodomonas_salina.1